MSTTLAPTTATRHQPPEPAGLCHAAPPVVTREQDLVIRSRWREWVPWVLMEAYRRSKPSGEFLRAAEQRHRERAILCIQTIAKLQSAHRWLIIRRDRLDSPLVSDDEFRAKLAAVVSQSEKHGCRFGHPKGVYRRNYVRPDKADKETSHANGR